MSYEQDTETKWRSRKWLLTCGFFVMLHIALFTGFVGEATYGILVPALLGVYSAANYMQKKEGK